MKIFAVKADYEFTLLLPDQSKSIGVGTMTLMFRANTGEEASQKMANLMRETFPAFIPTQFLARDTACYSKG